MLLARVSKHYHEEISTSRSGFRGNGKIGFEEGIDEVDRWAPIALTQRYSLPRATKWIDEEQFSQ